MTKKFKILAIFGTRPEALKMGPLIQCLARDDAFDIKTLFTGQHDELMKGVLEAFSISPDFDLKVMRPKQNLSSLTAKIISVVSSHFDIFSYDLVLVHGDTTTAMGAALSAFYYKIKVGHVEAGLRTGDIYSPWPEEMNRLIISRIAALHFAPTPMAASSLISENIAQENVYITGNTIIDAVNEIKRSISDDPVFNDKMESKFNFFRSDKKQLLVTAHRRENLGEKLENICDAIEELACNGTQLIVPVHPNPVVLETITRKLSSVGNVFLIEPLAYKEFIWLMLKSYLVLSDSGGVQEEAAALNKPLLILRETTERSEAVDNGCAILVGPEKGKIVTQTQKILNDSIAYNDMAEGINPFGDGRASKNILDCLKQQFLCH